MKLPNPLDTPTVSIPEGGWIKARLGRSASYDMAARGELPLIKVGRRYRVLTAPLLAELGLLELAIGTGPPNDDGRPPGPADANQTTNPPDAHQGGRCVQGT